VPADLFNRVVWEGVKGDQPYPDQRSGTVMRTVVTGEAGQALPAAALK